MSESNKALFTRINSTLVNHYYAIKLHLKSEYNFDTKKFDKEWEDGLRQYIFYRTYYINSGRYDIENITEHDLKSYMEQFPQLYWKFTNVILNKTIRRRYTDRKTTLVHVLLHQDMKPVIPGTWDNLTVEFMRPLYNCPDSKAVDSAPIGEFLTCIFFYLY